MKRVGGVNTVGVVHRILAGIFKAGFWVGIVIAVIVVVGLFALFGRRG